MISIDVSGFTTGKCAMFLSGIWKTPAFRKTRGFDRDIALFPKGRSMSCYPSGMAEPVLI